MKKRILVVDDSETALVMARDALEGAGFEVVTAPGAREADAWLYADQQPDLVILDVMMPLTSGDQKARMLKQDNRTRHIPVLLLSSKPETDLRRLANESGADGFIRKPFGQRQIVDQVAAALRRV